MIRNYLITAWRNILRHKIFSLINLFGLAIGMTVSILLFHFVYLEFNFDDFHPHKERVYRLIGENSQVKKGMPVTHEFVGPRLKSTFPEIEVATRVLSRRGTVSFEKEGKLTGFSEPNYYYADSNFFEIFNFQPSDPLGLHRPNSVMLSTSKAQQYFGNESPMGKIIRIYDDFGQVDYTVRGTFPDVPKHSHIQFDFLLSFHHLMGDVYEDKWLFGWRAFFNYVRLKPDASAQELEEKIPAFIASTTSFDKAGIDESEQLWLQPLMDIHLYSDFSFERALTTNIYWIYFLCAIALIIMILAWVNYINLSSAKAFERAREVGIRKVLGSQRKQLITQFLLESVLLNVLAVGIGFMLIQIFSPLIDRFFHFSVDIQSLISFSPLFLTLIFSFFLLGAIISSLYPALFLSRLQVVQVLKSKFRTSNEGLSLRKGMVIFQFAISLIMVVATFVVFKQTAYMQSQSLGLEIDQKLIVKAPTISDSTFSAKMDVLKQQLLTNPKITEIQASGVIPGYNFNFQTGVKLTHQAETERIPGQVAFVKAGFFEHFDIPLIVGRTFDEELDKNGQNIILSEAMVADLNFPSPTEALGQQLNLGNSLTPSTVVGVVKNYHHNSLRYNYDPIVFQTNDVTNYLSMQLQTSSSSLPDLIASIGESYQELFPANPYEYQFLDEIFEQKYQEETLMANYTGIFSGLALLIACLGLLGLSIFSVQQRTKEIGIRKVLGATANSIMYLLSKDYLKLLLIAIVISLPLCLWGIYTWLQSFAFPMEISWLVFALPILMVLFISLATVLIHTLLAVRMDPIEVLRNE